MRKVALVLAGGFCGTLARYLLAAPLLALAAPALPGARGGFPYDILAINLSGALAMGLLYGLVERNAAISPDVRLALGTGFLGAYTTFSTFVYGGERLIGAGQYPIGLAYLLGSVVLGVLCVRAGHSLAGALTLRPHRAWRQLRLARRRWQRASSRAGWRAPLRPSTRARDLWLRGTTAPTQPASARDQYASLRPPRFDHDALPDTRDAEDGRDALERQETRR